MNSSYQMGKVSRSTPMAKNIHCERARVRPPWFLLCHCSGTTLHVPSSETDAFYENLGTEVQYSGPRCNPTSTEKQFKLPSSPWTYDNEGVNPNLRPSNSSTLASHGHQVYTSALPPYHPDFDGDYSPRARQSYSPDSSDIDDDYQGIKVRRGSEGYEVHPLNREEMLRRYLEAELSREGRYQVYGADPPLEDINDLISDEELGLRN